MIGVSIIIFLANVLISYRRYKANPVDPGPDPWDARSLEWMIPSPAPEHNFDEIPVVEELDEFWHRKYGHDEDGRLVRIARTEDVTQKGDAENVHLPSPSYWPIVMSVGFPLIGYGLIFNLLWAIPGAICVIAAMVGWVMEPSTEPHDDHGGHEGPADGSDGPTAAAADLPEGEGESSDAGDDQGELVGAASGAATASAQTGDTADD